MCACIPGVCLALWAQAIWGAMLLKHWSCILKQDGPVFEQEILLHGHNWKKCISPLHWALVDFFSNSELHWSLFLIHKVGQLCHLHEVWVQCRYPSNRRVILSYQPLDKHEQQFSLLAIYSMQWVLKATSPIRRTERNIWNISDWYKEVGKTLLYGILIGLLHSIWAQADWPVFAQAVLPTVSPSLCCWHL